MTPPTIKASIRPYPSTIHHVNHGTPRGKKTAHLPNFPSHSTTSGEPVPTPPNEPPAQTYTNIRSLISDTDTVADLHDGGSILNIIKAKKKAILGHIWLLENGVECVVDGVSR